MAKPLCGNAAIEEGEECDGTDFTDTCMSRGYEKGILSCTTACRFDESKCSTCGDGKMSGDEVCDTTDFGEAQMCADEGQITCTDSCDAIDRSGCHNCGDGVREGPEECEESKAPFTDGKAACAQVKGARFTGEVLCGSCIQDQSACILGRTNPATGDTFSCALQNDKKILCWGNGVPNVGTGKYNFIASSGDDLCAIEYTPTGPGGIKCFKSSTRHSGSYRTFAASRTHQCAVATDGRLTCWGSDSAYMAKLNGLGDDYAKLAITDNQTCGLTVADGKIVCTFPGAMPTDFQNLPSDGPFSDIAIGEDFACAIDAVGEIYCHRTPWARNL